MKRGVDPTVSQSRPSAPPIEHGMLLPGSAKLLLGIPWNVRSSAVPAFALHACAQLRLIMRPRLIIEVPIPYAVRPATDAAIAAAAGQSLALRWPTPRAAPPNRAYHPTTNGFPGRWVLFLGAEIA